MIQVDMVMSQFHDRASYNMIWDAITRMLGNGIEGGINWITVSWLVEIIDQ